MKKSGNVGLVLIAALGLSTSCSRPAPPRSATGTMSWDDKPRDPCSPEHFQDDTCKAAVNNRGYHYGGHWFPMVYSGGYRNYYDNHRNHLARGGAHSPPPSSVYSPRATPMSTIKPPTTSSSSSSTQRGGFGSTASSSHTSSPSSHVSAGS